MAVKLNNNNLTPTDYTVELSGVPVNTMTDDEIKEEFKKNVRTHIHSNFETLRIVGG